MKKYFVKNAVMMRLLLALFFMLSIDSARAQKIKTPTDITEVQKYLSSNNPFYVPGSIIDRLVFYPDKDISAAINQGKNIYENTGTIAGQATDHHGSINGDYSLNGNSLTINLTFPNLIFSGQEGAYRCAYTIQTNGEFKSRAEAGIFLISKRKQK